MGAVAFVSSDAVLRSHPRRGKLEAIELRGRLEHCVCVRGLTVEREDVRYREVREFQTPRPTRQVVTAAECNTGYVVRNPARQHVSTIESKSVDYLDLLPHPRALAPPCGRVYTRTTTRSESWKAAAANRK